MSRRNSASVRKTREISRISAVWRIGVGFASELALFVCAALSCAVVGGCLVTSAEEFTEEKAFPPAVLDTPQLPLGGIVTVDQRVPSDLRLPITVRDENLDDVLSSQARLSVVGQPAYDFVCPGDNNIPPTGMVERLFEVVINPQKLKPGACTRVEVAVSKDFAGSCISNFGVPADDDDIARATYWIWEVSGEPQMNPGAAQGLVNTCQTVPSVQGTSTSMAQ